jgi:osmoprotectant transport system permease protein
MNYVHQAIVWLNDPLNWSNPGGIRDSLRQHIVISLEAMLIACLIGLPLGLWFGHSGRGGGIVVALSNTTRAIPIYGMLTIFVVIGGGLGASSVVPALAIFAIPPVLANTYTGIRTVDPEARDAARGMGLSGGQLLRRVEVPLAVPYIATGIRSATVQVVATATLAALVAGGGLGTIISAGFGLTIAAGGGQILAGGFLVAVLALLTNAVLGIAAYYVTPAPLRRVGRLARWRRRRAALGTADAATV